MDPESKLRNVIAGLIDIPESEVTPELSLRVQKFRSSAGRAILKTALKKHLGKEVDVTSVSTFGDLLAAVNGRDASAANSVHLESEATIGAEVDAFSPPEPDFGTLASCGVDIENITIFPETEDYWTHEFYTGHFTAEEIAYCVAQEFPRQHFAAMWCAKEALKKAADHFMRMTFSQIQICHRSNGSAYIQQSRNGKKWQTVPAALSLSHTDTMAIAFIVMVPS